ncbi:hypothetical protein LWP59_13675 [Amycolatopsis acidiphila]|uniref:Cyclase n=1 Tax=Amycolatopsis acidiphila TaxID=715473 RepID=A0A558AJ43_9PSEU|nr:hypothetical protein [Amycolatopsis acidiphila]TVT24269.1 hypothetical protein FNH06_06780 [Amycolatopsis acidiphila]UIJ62601.1 hypothetical protein LWP59_13675 [Amycolatopsis acidiphila]GHG85689.1 hypothetical protein GCM10017788_58530 [Amycolatopsis acidiphila]
MPTLLTQHDVADFDAWRAVFAGHQDNRRAHGATAHHIYRDGSTVVVLTDFPTRAAIEAFLADPALVRVSAAAGFLAPPVTRIVDPVDVEVY